MTRSINLRRAILDCKTSRPRHHVHDRDVVEACDNFRAVDPDAWRIGYDL